MSVARIMCRRWWREACPVDRSLARLKLDHTTLGGKSRLRKASYRLWATALGVYGGRP